MECRWKDAISYDNSHFTSTDDLYLYPPKHVSDGLRVIQLADYAEVHICVPHMHRNVMEGQLWTETGTWTCLT